MPRIFVLKAFLFAGLRRLSRFYPAKNEAMRGARIAPGRYRCNACKADFSISDVVVDHINPVIDPAKGFEDWNTYIDRLFCPANNLQCLCRPCHTVKTTAEVKARKATRKAKKELKIEKS